MSESKEMPKKLIAYEDKEFGLSVDSLGLVQSAIVLKQAREAFPEHDWNEHNYIHEDEVQKQLAELSEFAATSFAAGPWQRYPECKPPEEEKDYLIWVRDMPRDFFADIWFKDEFNGVWRFRFTPMDFVIAWSEIAKPNLPEIKP
jgi:hypothetical protein